MRFEWDPAKRELYLWKHGIDFADTESVLDDPMAITVMDDEPIRRHHEGRV